MVSNEGREEVKPSDSTRLSLVEQRQKEMTNNLAILTKSMEANTKVTLQIQRTLDELTGAKKFLVWFTSFVLGMGVIIATLIGVNHK